MSAREDIFAPTIQKTYVWLRELMNYMGWEDEYKAYHGLRAVLHALRDRLTIDECAHLGAQMPMLVRGLYYEGWKPSGKPLKENKNQFLQSVREKYGNEDTIILEELITAVFKVLSRQISAGEIEDVRQNLPKDLQSLWA